MNWITKFIKPRLKTLLKKRQPKPSETGLWTTCVCQQLIYKEDLHNNFFVYSKKSSTYVFCKIKIIFPLSVVIKAVYTLP